MREILLAAIVATTGLFAFGHNSASLASDLETAAVAVKAAEIEQRMNARIGIAILDTESDTLWGYRGDERFPLNSTFKAFACAAMLSRVDRGELDLRSSVPIRERDLVSYSPVTEKVAGRTGMTLLRLCDAAMTISDNTAANLVLRIVGGPAGLNEFLRSIGDHTTRVDRVEPALNDTRPGDPRDTTTPYAAARNLHRLVLGDVLSEPSGEQLTTWLAENQVSGALIRAALPSNWRIGDRSGAGRTGSRSVIAVIWPPHRGPVVTAIYLADAQADMSTRNRAIAEVGRVIVEQIKARQ